MRYFVCGLAFAVILTGCAGPKSKQTGDMTHVSVDGKRNQSKMIVTPETLLVGKVVRVNVNARFAVLNFPVGTMPALGQQLNVYRQGLKVGEVKATGPQQDDNVVADIINGNAQVGDELRAD
jgi:hypothetical protein